MERYSNTIVQLLIIAVIFGGLYACVSIGRCTENENEKAYQIEKAQTTLSDGFEIWVIDSCEYIYKTNDYPHNLIFTHKGNCGYCTSRNKNKI